MNPFKYIVYFIVWSLLVAAGLIFYSKFVYRNRKRFRRNGATIAVSNHPNTLFDPMGVAAHLNRFVHILANAGLYKNPALGWFLGNTFGVKVERPEDVKDGVKIKNDQAFRFAEEFLTKGGCLYIAPEGGSDIPRRLRKLKTGTARIALATENKNDFKLGLEILPVGLNYTSQTEFRSQVFINVGEPIRVADFESNFRKDDFQGALDLTAEMDKQMRELLIDTIDNEEDAFLRKLEIISQTENKLPLDTAFDRSQQLLNGWRKYKDQFSKEAEDFKNKIHTYFDFLQKNKIRDQILTKTQESNFKSNFFFKFIFLLIGLPIFIYGWVNNFLANYIPGWVNKKSGLHIAYSSTVKVLVGLITYSLFYWLQIRLVKHYASENWMVWGYVASLILTGLFAWWYKDFAKDTLSGWRVFNFLKKRKNEKDEVFTNRNFIVTKINHLLQITS